MDERRFEFSGRLIFGIVVLLFGVALLMDEMNISEARDILRWWPALLIATGLCHLTGFGAQRRPLLGGVFTVAGSLILANNLDWFGFEVWSLWPLALIAFGASILFRSIRGPGAVAGAAERGEWIRSFAIWSGLDRKAVSDHFRGAELSAVMGGIELDLRSAKPADGRCVLDVFVLWGGIDIKLPEGWRVSNEAMAIMGGIEDGTKPAPDGNNLLVLRGSVVMGGIELKN
jgi:hypothetical protein